MDKIKSRKEHKKETDENRFLKSRIKNYKKRKKKNFE